MLTTTSIFTTLEGIEGKQLVRVEFQEQVCTVTKNKSRWRRGLLPDGYRCVQMKATMTLCKDAKGRPIDEEIVYRSNCQLKCLNKNCWESEKK